MQIILTGRMGPLKGSFPLALSDLPNTIRFSDDIKSRTQLTKDTLDIRPWYESSGTDKILKGMEAKEARLDDEAAINQAFGGIEI